MSVTLTITGIKELDDVFREMPKALSHRTLGAAFEDAAKPLVEKEKLLQILDRNHQINWITFLHDMHIMTSNKKLNNFLEDLRANELTTLVLPATDGWNYLIIVYFYQSKSKGMQAVIEQLYKKYLDMEPVFIG